VSDCIFCKIASGEIKTPLIYSNDIVVAFHDINPQAPKHILVVPKEHIKTINDLHEKPGLSAALMNACIEVAKITGLDKDGYRIVANCGEKAGQSVWHLHFHVLGGRPMKWPPG